MVLVDKMSCVLSEIWSIILNLTLSLLKENKVHHSKLSKKNYLKTILDKNYFIQPYTEASPFAFSVEAIFCLSRSRVHFILLLSFIHQSEVWMLVLTYFNRLMYTSAKTKWHLYFHFFQLSLLWWLIVCNDVWLLPQRKKGWSPLHSTFPFLGDFVTPTLSVVGPLALGIYKINLYMSVTHLGLH